MKDRLIVISHPTPFPEEVLIWRQMLDAGLCRLHIRKPGVSQEEMKRILSAIPPSYRKRMVVHHFTELMNELGLAGVHYRFKDIDPLRSPLVGSVSCSIHSWEEMEQAEEAIDYCFISPVYDSISKQDYAANPSLEQVPVQFRMRKIYALGGINKENAPSALQHGYYGVVAMGAVWSSDDPVRAFQEIFNKVHSAAPCLENDR